MVLSDCCIISCGVGGWYPRGIDRLSTSLIEHQWKGASLFFRNYPLGCPTHEVSPYAFKIHALNQAIQKGFTKILWLDASIWAIKDPAPFFEYIKKHGYYFFKTGYNCAQSCNDRILDYIGKSRDEAEKMTEAATGCVGLDLKNHFGREFYMNWIKFMKDGMFHGSRLHDDQSKDPRFLFHRQDQSAASLIINHFKMKINDPGDFIAYTAHKQYFGTETDKNKLTFLIQGM